MRQFKIRAWDKRNEVLFCDGSLGLLLDGRIVGRDGQRINNDKYVLMQWTGLKDRNGKDIFEGDIVKLHRRNFMDSGSCGQIMFTMTGKVVYDIEELTFIVIAEYNNPWSLLHHKKYDDDFKPLESNEVVGNIYEDSKEKK